MKDIVVKITESILNINDINKKMEKDTENAKIMSKICKVFREFYKPYENGSDIKNDTSFSWNNILLCELEFDYPLINIDNWIKKFINKIEKITRIRVGKYNISYTIRTYCINFLDIIDDHNKPLEIYINIDSDREKITLEAPKFFFES